MGSAAHKATVVDAAPAETQHLSRAHRVSLLVDDIPSEKAIAAGPRSTEAWLRSLEDAVLDLVNEWPSGTQDMEARNLLRLLVELTRAVRAGEAEGADLLVIKMHDVLRRLRERRVAWSLDDPDTAVNVVLETMQDVPAKDLASILGVSTRTISNWRHGAPVGSANARRVHVVAICVEALRETMTRTGIVMWFDASVAQLGGRSPLELLEESVDDAAEPVTRYAAGGRG